MLVVQGIQALCMGAIIFTLMLQMFYRRGRQQKKRRYRTLLFIHQAPTPIRIINQPEEEHQQQQQRGEDPADDDVFSVNEAIPTNDSGYYESEGRDVTGIYAV